MNLVAAHEIVTACSEREHYRMRAIRYATPVVEYRLTKGKK